MNYIFVNLIKEDQINWPTRERKTVEAQLSHHSHSSRGNKNPQQFFVNVFLKKNYTWVEWNSHYQVESSPNYRRYNGVPSAVCHPKGSTRYWDKEGPSIKWRRLRRLVMYPFVVTTRRERRREGIRKALNRKMVGCL